jgi:hypothetical protein
MATEEVKTPEQQYVYHTDQLASVNAFLDVDIDGEVVRFQVTSRYHASPEKIAATTKAAIEALKQLRKDYPRPNAFVPKNDNGSEPTRTNIDDNGNALPEILKGRAGRLSFDVKDGKTFFKIMDAQYQGKGTKYGVTIWPETMKAAGLEIVEGQPTPDITNWEFEYINNEKGYPQKVTRLLPPK